MSETVGEAGEVSEELSFAQYWAQNVIDTGEIDSEVTDTKRDIEEIEAIIRNNETLSSMGTKLTSRLAIGRHLQMRIKQGLDDLNAHIARNYVKILVGGEKTIQLAGFVLVEGELKPIDSSGVVYERADCKVMIETIDD